jgi:hypothetical protein
LTRWANPARWALTIFLEEALIIFYRAGLSQLSQNPPPTVAITSNQAAFAKGIQCGLRMAEGEASCDCNICLRSFASSEFMKASRLCT